MKKIRRLNPDKLSVHFRNGVTNIEPVIPRRYTLTHSDITGQLFLTIGLTYAYDKVTEKRDEVLGEWVKTGNCFVFYVYLHINGTYDITTASIRDVIFRKELPLALEAIRYGDKDLFHAYPMLDNAFIKVHFMSSIPLYNRTEDWGTFSTYK